MLIAIIIFCVMFVLLASAGLLLVHRAEAARELAAGFVPQEEKKSLSTKFQSAAVSLGSAVGQLEGIVPKSKAEVSVVQQRMIRAGLRRESAVSIFYGAKLVAMVGLVALVWLTGLASFSYFFVITLALVLGYMGPDFWLTNRIKHRQKKIRLGLPDVLDLLIVCVEAGLSLDQATMRTAEELAKSTKSEVGDELTMVVLEQRAGCPRADAWKHFADRTDVDNVRSVVSMLVQSEQFGTSVAKTLRVHSETMRTQRIQQVEEQAAKASIKMLFPLILLIFPSIFVVILGPAVILMLDSFNTNLSH